jgi:hypothetical protein
MFFIPTNLQNHNDMTKVQTIFDINTTTGEQCNTEFSRTIRTQLV